MNVVMWSAERLRPMFGWHMLGPSLQNALSAYEGVRVLAPPHLHYRDLGEWRMVLRSSGRVDCSLWLQWSSRPELAISFAALAVRSARRAAYVLDPWKPQIGRIGRLAVMQGLCPLFVSYREAYEDLRSQYPRGNFKWLPVGVDIEYFTPGTREARDVFAYYMGRRYEPLHQALLKYCGDRGLDYRYDLPGVAPIFGASAELARRSKYFVVTPPNLQDPARTGGYSPLVMRYLEGLAAGARLLGVLPGSGDYQALGLPLEAVLQVAADGSDLHEKVDNDVQKDTQPAVNAAMQQVRSKHSWTNRAQTIYEELTREV